MERIKETIKVKNEPEVKFAVRITPHGSIVTDFFENYKDMPLARREICRDAGPPPAGRP